MNKLKYEVIKYWNDKRFIRVNTLAWLMIYLSFLLLNLLMNGLNYNSAFLHITVAIFFMVVFFYMHFFICAAYFRKSNLLFFLYSAALFALYLLLMYWQTIHDYERVADKSLTTKGAFFFMQLFLSTLYYLIIIAISTIVWSLKRGKEKDAENEQTQAALQLRNAALEQQKLALQRDLFQSENDFLRAQINPHFLYNCLNFLYSETFQQQPKVADGIMLLSQIMRYSLTDFSGTNGMANVQDEIAHIENVIMINALRFENTLQIKLNVEGDATGKKIAPMLLITIVENVFKHGDLQDSTFPAMINCEISTGKKLLYFTTCNRINRTPLGGSSGVGIANIRQRLQLLYKDDFTLNFVENDSVFKTEMIIPYIDDL